VELVAGETEVLGENLPSSTLSTTNPTLSDLGSNPDSSGGKSVTNFLSYSTAINPFKKLLSYIISSIYFHILSIVQF
jgi:hypothetical protein